MLPSQDQVIGLTKPFTSNQMSAAAVAGHRSSLFLNRAVLATCNPREVCNPLTDGNVQPLMIKRKRPGIKKR